MKENEKCPRAGEKLMFNQTFADTKVPMGTIMKDIVIIGGGLSGLYCAALLSKKGKSVTLLEKHITVGGLAAGFRRKGYYFDSGISRFVAETSAGYFKKLKIFDELDFIGRTASFNIEGKTFIPKDVKDYFNILCGIFPEYKESLLKFYKDHIKNLAAFMRVNAKTGALSYSGLNQIFKMIRMMSGIIFSGNLTGVLSMMKNSDLDFEETLAQYIDKDSKLFSIMTGGNYDIFFKNGRKNMITFIGYLCSTFELNKSPRQGFQNLCDMIAGYAENNGCKIHTGADVTEIDIKNNQAAGVFFIKNNKQEYMKADIVIHAGDLMKAYFKLLKPRYSDKFLEAMLESKTTKTMPILYLGLKIPSSRILECFSGKREIVYFPEITCKSKPAEQKDYYKHAPFIMHSSSIDEPSHAPEGASGIQVYLACPEDGWQNNWQVINGKRTGKYKELKKAVIEDVLRNIESIIPDIADRSLIDICELGTSHTFERFTGNTNGSHCGFS